MRTLKIQTSITINAPIEQVWKTFTDPKAVKKFMFGADLKTTWQPGTPIVYTGEYQGKPYEERGEILAFEPPTLLKTTNLSSMSGKDDKPGNYDIISYRFIETGGRTRVVLVHENIKSEKSAEGSKANWKIMLKTLKRVAEAAAKND